MSAGSVGFITDDDAVATARGASDAGEQRAQPLEGGDGAEVVHPHAQLGRRHHAGVGHDGVDAAAAGRGDLVDQRGAARRRREVGGDRRVVEVDVDHPVAVALEALAGRAPDARTPSR